MSYPITHTFEESYKGYSIDPFKGTMSLEHLDAIHDCFGKSLFCHADLLLCAVRLVTPLTVTIDTSSLFGLFGDELQAHIDWHIRYHPVSEPIRFVWVRECSDSSVRIFKVVCFINLNVILEHELPEVEKMIQRSWEKATGMNQGCRANTLWFFRNSPYKSIDTLLPEYSSQIEGTFKWLSQLARVPHSLKISEVQLVGSVCCKRSHSKLWV